MPRAERILHTVSQRADGAVEHNGRTMIDIVEADHVSPALVAAFERLIPQLSKSNPPPSAERLAQIVESPATVLLIAIDRDVAGGAGGNVLADAILGSMTLALFVIPTGLRAWIEDVVVDQGARGRGVGEALNKRAIEVARDRGATSIDLTSRPSRGAANRLYQRMGFAVRDTNVYRYTPGD